MRVFCARGGSPSMSSVSPRRSTVPCACRRSASPHPVPRPGPDSADGLDEETVFYPFLSGRENLRAVARQCGLGDHRVDVVLGQAGLAERAGTPWPTTATACGNGWAWPRRPLSGPFHLALSEGEDGPRSRCLTRPESTGSQALSRSSLLPVSGQGSSTLRRMIVPSPVRRSSQVTYTDGEPGGSSSV